MAEIFKFPYDACRRVHSRKPRRSKNGTPEERAAKAAALETTPADVVAMSDARTQARSEVDGGSFAAVRCVTASARSRLVQQWSGRCTPRG
jgi:hypothetical protein